LPTRCRNPRICALARPWFALLALAAGPVLAQTPPPPDAGRILQETRPVERAPAPTIAPLQAPPAAAPTAPAGSADVRVQVNQFEFSGNHALSKETLNAVVARWSGRALNFGELIEAVEAVEARYKAEGYFLVQGYLPPQKIKSGSVEIAISEGTLGEVRLEGESRIDPGVVYGYLERLPKGQPLTLRSVERQVLLINELAGSHASLDLQAGEAPGSTDIVIAQAVDPLLSSHIDLNNHGSPSTGNNRLALSVNANGPFGKGERLSANVMMTDTGNLYSYNLRGELPVGAQGWRLSAAASRATYTLGGDFASMNASGTADALRLGASYPIVRSRQSNIKLQLEIDESKLSDHFKANTPPTDLDKQSRGLTATLGGDWLDQNSSTRAEMAWRSAQIDMGSTAATLDAPPTGPGAAGHFSKLSLSAQHQRSLGQYLSVQLQWNAQLASKNLDSSEKLSLGGPATMPGYANGEASGDSGQMLKLALRWQATPTLGLGLFADWGQLQLLRNPLPAATTPNDKSMSDIGLSADWQLHKDVTLSALLAWAVHEAPNPTDDARPRAWLNLGYNW